MWTQCESAVDIAMSDTLANPTPHACDRVLRALESCDERDVDIVSPQCHIRTSIAIFRASDERWVRFKALKRISVVFMRCAYTSRAQGHDGKMYRCGIHPDSFAAEVYDMADIAALKSETRTQAEELALMTVMGMHEAALGHMREVRSTPRSSHGIVLMHIRKHTQYIALLELI